MHTGTCEAYCNRHGLHCEGMRIVRDEDPCNDNAGEERDCHHEWYWDNAVGVCKCGGERVTRRNRPPTNHGLLDYCWGQLDQYEMCAMRFPELHDQMPDPMIRQSMEKERNQKCANIDKDVFDRLNLVGCSR